MRADRSVYRFSALIAALAFFGVGCVRPAVSPVPPVPVSPSATLPPRPSTPALKEVNLSILPGAGPAFAVTLTVPVAWEAEVVPELEAINLYDSAAPGETSREKSQVFLRHFRADDFLTLSTVTIHERTPTTVAGRPAVTYAIEKKPGVPPFPGQPSWRNARHRVTDVRLRDASPSEFLVFAQNPVLADDHFLTVLSSLQLTPTTSSPTAVLPVRGFFAAVTKKPFGIFVTPENSPVSPERFRGFHTAADAELPSETPVFAVTGGIVVRSGRVAGYGGLAAIEHRSGAERFVGVYGHLDPASLPRLGSRVRAGEQIGVLGAAFSAETDGERAHLHFGLYTGPGVNVAGYVPTREALSMWRDPVVFLRAENTQDP